MEHEWRTLAELNPQHGGRIERFVGRRVGLVRMEYSTSLGFAGAEERIWRKTVDAPMPLGVAPPKTSHVFTYCPLAEWSPRPGDVFLCVTPVRRLERGESTSDIRKELVTYNEEHVYHRAEEPRWNLVARAKVEDAAEDTGHRDMDRLTERVESLLAGVDKESAIVTILSRMRTEDIITMLAHLEDTASTRSPEPR